MYETLIRPHQVDVVPPLPSIDAISTQLKQSEARREAKRLRQIANSRQARGEKRKRDNEQKNQGTSTDADTRNMDADGAEEDVYASSSKKTKIQEDGAGNTATGEAVSSVASSSGAAAVEKAPEAYDAVVSELSPESATTSKLSVSKAFPEVRGHTSYLTFAVLLPESVRAIKERALAVQTEQTDSAGEETVLAPPDGATETMITEAQA